MRLNILKAIAASLVITLSSVANAGIISTGDIAINQSIPDRATVTDTYTETSTDIIDNVWVYFDATSSWIGDFEVMLSHNGVNVLILDNQGGPQDAVNDWFSDLYATAPTWPQVADTSTNYGFLPSQSLSAFNGLSAQGDWALTVTDTLSADSGFVNSWALQFSTHSAQVPEPSTLAIFALAILGFASRKFSK
ncbi:proprotein convertase P-domain-containing protein [Thalassotalea sp. PLHSN55]|uniref:proprotein convertase P-domain-containing protein n=1 Tax=Thalassotalea sp. PLHSN55 TaxID=3435888 RepID=UPI003F85D5B1